LAADMLRCVGLVDGSPLLTALAAGLGNPARSAYRTAGTMSCEAALLCLGVAALGSGGSFLLLD
jgi:hypothetical protein